MNKIFWRVFIISCCLALGFSCVSDPMPAIFSPTITTGAVDNIYRKGATLHGNIQNPQAYPVEGLGIEYTRLIRPGMTIEQYFATAEKVEVEHFDENGDFSVTLDSLEPGGVYLYRSYAGSGQNYVYGEDSSFTTPQNTNPTFGEVGVNNITYTSFDISAELLDDGGKELETMAYLYKDTKDMLEDEELNTKTPGVQTVYVTSLAGKNRLESSIQNLYAGHRYAIRPYGVAFGTGYGRTIYVQTLVSNQALLSVCDTSKVSYNSVHLKASVLSENQQYPISEVGFCYSSESKDPQISHLSVLANLQGTDFDATLVQLNSDTKYYIRAYAKNTNGEYVYGEVVEYLVVLHDVLEVSTLPIEPSEVSTVSVCLRGSVRNNNVEIKERGFCMSMENRVPDIINSSHKIDLLGDKESYTENYCLDMEINYNSTYYYRAYAKNSKDEVYYGEAMSFTSKDIELPMINKDSLVEIKENRALIAMSFSLDYKYREGHQVDYGVVLSSDNADPALGADNIVRTHKEVSLEDNVEGKTITVEGTFEFTLKPDTKYYYRVYAQNSKGTQYSSIASFTTPKRTPTIDDLDYPEIQF